MTKKFAVAILNWNGEQLLRQFLPSVLQYSDKANIYVIDNASTDQSIEVLYNEFPEIKIIQNNDNYGFAKGYNEGLKDIKEPYLVLLNSDIEVTENWLDSVEDIFDTQPKVAIIQPKILDYKQKTHFEYAGAAGGFIDSYGFPFCRGRIFDTIEEDLGQYDDIIDIFWASGACFFIRNEVYQILGGLDEDYFAHQEEIDLCWRAHNNGYKIKYTGFSKVYHVGGATLQYQSPKKTYLNFRNSLLTLYKNLPKESKFSTIFIRLCLDGVAGVRYMLMLQPKHCFAIIRSHFAFYKRISKFKRKVSITPVSNYYRTKSIVKLYYIQKQKTYIRVF
ncbi:glycosyltransferase family 2 protein [Myroides sp. M-43]|uniref:glycosyltransferase family 2 protein n=1 Tax=Myroides oncorhynchi TaxID=2893756 RepID=UPI001E545F0A|nr:glycosyltransferase family 2 protein [Myroides oncorhynchi]MCC9044150.1 glycosyltransferase family 2 protein [Myroides oncorhynchi]